MVLEYLGGPHVITRVLIGNGDRAIRGREGDVMTEADVREEREIWRCSTVSFEDGGKECRKPVSFRSRRLSFPAKKMDSPLNLWK